MGLGTVALLEIKQVPSDNRIAYCLPSGEFIFVADTCAPEFGAENAADLYGDNLFHFLSLGDAERTRDFLRAQHHENSKKVVFPTTQTMRIMVRIPRNPSTQLWIQLSTVSLTLRMMRCIDTIRSLSSPLGHFADSSSFVLSKDEFSLVLQNRSERSGSATVSDISSVNDEDDELKFFELESSYLSPTSFTSDVPLELKNRHPNFAMIHNYREGPGVGVTNETDEDLKASLSNLAFEADWCSEIVRDEPTNHLVFCEESVPSTSSSDSMPVGSKPSFRPELVI
ncbi:hypothetical protein PsorP6_008115 [Peronosclerospora sorghi]|uniref:Uncharacterized protein n=1 Tax=Peronosclerospora sorghi TaxID=230839 RepID=A0ACC0W6M7_9STRA|nr:hypothetical protein PsorP6_008115 [Peronosclerospora sorghi]